MNVVRLARAFAFGAPLAVLVAAYVSPPDPLSQLLFIAVGLPLFVAGAYVSIAESGNARTLVAFFGTIFVTTILGTIVSNALHAGTAGRVLVLAIAVAVGLFVAGRIG